MQFPAQQPSLAFVQPAFPSLLMASSTPFSSETLAPRPPQPKRVRKAGRVLLASGLLLSEAKALGRDLSEAGRIAAYVGRELPAAIAADVAALVALAGFIFAGCTAAAILTGQVPL